jgi:hypothetical protein
MEHRQNNADKKEKTEVAGGKPVPFSVCPPKIRSRLASIKFGPPRCEAASFPFSNIHLETVLSDVLS